jgi:hypothetical protein
MKYEIVSPRVGKPGTEYEPQPGVNLAPLLANGFIKESPQKPKNRGKIETKPKE